MSWGQTFPPAKGYDEELLPADAFGYRHPVRRSPFKYTAGNEQMMKEYNMTEAEFAYEFGGRPHQQRQSPVSRTDLMRLRIPGRNWDYCSHKYIPFKYCQQAFGYWHSNGHPDCAHYLHEFEICLAAEIIRQNQVAGIKRRMQQAYTTVDKNWLYNDPDWGHLMWRSIYSPISIKAGFMMGGSSRVIDPPTHEMTMQQNAKYNPDQVRSTPHHNFHHHTHTELGQAGIKWFWNRFAMYKGAQTHHKRAAGEMVPFDPLLGDGDQMKPW